MVPDGQVPETLAAPLVDPANPTVGDLVPTWQWAPVPGAVSYDFHLEFPNGVARDFKGIPSNAATPTLLKGTGVWHWQVRANFPQVGSTIVRPGPWSARQAFTRTIREPANAGHEAGPNHVVFSWSPKLGAQNYRVQISTRADFSAVVENTTTDKPVLRDDADAPRVSPGRHVILAGRRRRRHRRERRRFRLHAPRASGGEPSASAFEDGEQDQRFGREDGASGQRERNRLAGARGETSARDALPEAERPLRPNRLEGRRAHLAQPLRRTVRAPTRSVTTARAMTLHGWRTFTRAPRTTAVSANRARA